MKPDPEIFIEFYLDADFSGEWNQEEGKDPGSVHSRTGYVISYSNCPIIFGEPVPDKNSAQHNRGRIYCFI